MRNLVLVGAGILLLLTTARSTADEGREEEYSIVGTWQTTSESAFGLRETRLTFTPGGKLIWRAQEKGKDGENLSEPVEDHGVYTYLLKGEKNAELMTDTRRPGNLMGVRETGKLVWDSKDQFTFTSDATTADTHEHPKTIYRRVK